MSKHRNKEQDIQTTIMLVASPNGYPELTVAYPNWLGHSGAAAKIDAELLIGITMESMLVSRKTALDHLYHLKVEHNLKIEERNGEYRIVGRTDR